MLHFAQTVQTNQPTNHHELGKPHGLKTEKSKIKVPGELVCKEQLPCLDFKIATFPLYAHKNSLVNSQLLGKLSVVEGGLLLLTEPPNLSSLYDLLTSTS